MAVTTFKRYTVACRWCRGDGFHEDKDEDGNRLLTDCTCYRGRLTFRLTRADEEQLFAELKESLGQ